MSAAHVALVVGADGPVGRWVAQSLCHEGWQVYATTQHADDVLFLRALGATVLSLDLASAESVQKLSQLLLALHVPLDALVVCTEQSLFGAVGDVGMDDVHAHWHRLFAGAADLVQRLLSALWARDGRIVVLGAPAGTARRACMTWHLAARHALSSWFAGVEPMLRDSGVGVVEVHPPVFVGDEALLGLNTALQRAAGGDFRDLLQRQSTRWLAGARPGQPRASPADVADVLVQAAMARWPRRRYVVHGYPHGLAAKLWQAARWGARRLGLRRKPPALAAPVSTLFTETLPDP
ncbi:MAG: hypothetical protein CFE46_09750 [Burkholderiales bacterium PBB6]|nr:MAG: hypothetical protein CFE46_09750 [Burkholderiales bacterium PBB6]